MREAVTFQSRLNRQKNFDWQKFSTDFVTVTCLPRTRSKRAFDQSHLEGITVFQFITKPLSQFHEDEDGIEAIQVVMIVAIAAIVLIAFMTVGKEVFSWMKEKWNEMKGSSIE